jgi:hypothetical protein
MKHVKLGTHDTRSRQNTGTKIEDFVLVCATWSLRSLKLALRMLNGWLSVDFNIIIRNLSFNRLKFTVCGNDGLHWPLSYEGGYLNFSTWWIKNVLFEQKKIKSS